MPIYARRGQVTSAHKLAITVILCFTFLIQLAVPHYYDLLNRQLFDDAENSGRLVIQEFKPLYEINITKQCGIEECTQKSLTSSLANSRLISLDYYQQMLDARRLHEGLDRFYNAVALVGGLYIVFVALLTFLPIGAAVRSILCVGLFAVAVAWIHLFGDLPHKNTKFYYLTGSLMIVVVSLGDYLSRIDIYVSSSAGTPAQVCQAFQEKHRKWSAILGYSVAFGLTILGTISFQLLDTIRIVFGESFYFYPMLGIVVVSLYAALIYVIFIIGGIRGILFALEEKIAGTPDKPE